MQKNATINPLPEIKVDQSAADDLIARMENLLQTDMTLDGAMYRPDIPIRTKAQRRKVGLPSESIIWPCQGDLLHRLPLKTAGLH